MSDDFLNDVLFPIIEGLVHNRIYGDSERIRRCMVWKIGIMAPDRYNKLLSTVNKAMKDKAVQPSSEDGKISYLRNGKRYRLTTRRFLTRILKLNESLSDKSLDFLAAEIDKQLAVKSEIRLLKGDEIRTAYANCVGGSSCMTGDNSEYVGLYVDNPRKIRLAVCRINHESARCIVWKTNRGLVHDRIYGDSERTRELLSDTLKRQNIPNAFLGFLHDKLYVRELWYTDGEIPYCDTFRGGQVQGEGKISLKNGSWETDNYVLESQEGLLDDEDSCHCTNCEDRIDDIYFVGNDPYCQYCFDEYFNTCYQCNEPIINDAVIRGPDDNSYCKDCHDEKFKLCNICEEYFDNDDMKQGPDCEHYCEDCYDANFMLCYDCEEYFDNDDIEQGPDYNSYCKDCYNENFTVCKGCGAIHDDFKAITDDEKHCISCYELKLKE